MALRFRFSLLSLVCFVLLVASGGLLWWNWESWVPGYTIDSEKDIVAAGFVPGGKRVYVREGGALRLYDALDGKHVRTLQFGSREEEFLFSPDGKYVSIGKWGSKEAAQSALCPAGIWSIEDGTWHPFYSFQRDEPRPIVFSPHGNYGIISVDQKRFLIRIPSMERVAEVDSNALFYFSANEKWLGFHLHSPGKMSVEVYSVPDWKLAFSRTNPTFSQPFSFSKSEELFALDAEGKTNVYETRKWTLLGSVSGSVYDNGISNNGRVLVNWNGGIWLRHIDEEKFSKVLIGKGQGTNLLGHFAESVIVRLPFVCWDTSTGTVKFNREPVTTGHMALTPGGQFVVFTRSSDEGFEFIDTEEGLTRGRIKAWRWRHVLPGRIEGENTVTFNDVGTQFITRPNKTRVVVWNWEKRNMPWDMLWRAEVWLTLAAAGTLGWRFAAGEQVS